MDEVTRDLFTCLQWSFLSALWDRTLWNSSHISWHTRYYSQPDCPLMSFTSNSLWLMVTVLPVQFFVNLLYQKFQITGDVCCIFHISGTRYCLGVTGKALQFLQAVTRQCYFILLLWLFIPLMECYQFKADKLSVVPETRGRAMFLYRGHFSSYAQLVFPLELSVFGSQGLCYHWQLFPFDFTTSSFDLGTVLIFSTGFFIRRAFQCVEAHFLQRDMT